MFKVVARYRCGDLKYLVSRDFDIRTWTVRVSEVSENGQEKEILGHVVNSLREALGRIPEDALEVWSAYEGY